MNLESELKDLLTEEQKKIIAQKVFERVIEVIESEEFGNNIMEGISDYSENIAEWIFDDLTVGEATEMIQNKINEIIKSYFKLGDKSE